MCLMDCNLLQSAPLAKGPKDLENIPHPSKIDLEGISPRSPEDVVPVEECKRALGAAPIFDEALYRCCAVEDEGEEDNEFDDGGWDDGNDRDAENTQKSSSSPRQDCILMQMELFPMPNFGFCESLPDAPPTPNPAHTVTPVPATVTPAPVMAPARKPLPVDADGPARAIPKREVEPHSLKGVLVRSPDDDPACDLAKRFSHSASSAEI